MSANLKTKQLFATIDSIVKEILREGGTHDYEHTKRVFNLALKIGAIEGADVEIVGIAALLHDIARPLEDMGKVDDHASAGAKIAREILKKINYPEDKIEAVAHAIEAHRFSKGPEPRTLEAKILSDADKLDAIGAIGVARVFMYSGEHGRGVEESLKHFEEKILKLENLMYTPSAREIAKERSAFVRAFVERLRREIKGEL